MLAGPSSENFQWIPSLEVSKIAIHRTACSTCFCIIITEMITVANMKNIAVRHNFYNMQSNLPAVKTVIKPLPSDRTKQFSVKMLKNNVSFPRAGFIANMVG